MSQAHIDLIKKGAAAFSRGDWDAALELCGEDIVWVAKLATVDGTNQLYGREAVKKAWEGQRELLGGEAFGVEVLDFRDLGAGTVLIRLRISGRGAASGVPIEVNYVQLWTLRSGLAVRVDNYESEDEALEAAGLSG